MGDGPHVGTLGEKPLHAALKRWYADGDDRVEQPVDGYVVDVVRGDLLIEIQTRSFASMKRKVRALLDDGYEVRVVHPIAVDRYIVKLDDADEVTSRRMSPKHGVAADVFAELVSFPEFLEEPGLTLEVLFTREDEIRRHHDGKAWRRNGWVTEERRLIEVVDRLVLDTPEALLSLLPDDLPDEFTTADLADALGRPRRLAQQMTYCLRNIGTLDLVGKDGNAIIYRRAEAGIAGVST